MLKIASISFEGEVGQIRANEEMLAWKGSESGAVLSVDLQSISEAAWKDGQVRLRHSDAAGEAAVLGFSGFPDHTFAELSNHLAQYAQVALAKFDSTPVEPAAVEALPVLLGTAAPKILDDEDIRKIACGEVVEEKVDIQRPAMSVDKVRDWACPDVQAAPVRRVHYDGDEYNVAEVAEPVVEQPSAVQTPVPVTATATSEPPAARGIKGLIQRRIGRSDDSSDEESFLEPVRRPAAASEDIAEKAYPDSILEGWVWKQSRWMKRWRRRYLVLTPEGLLSYKRRGDAVPSYRVQGITQCTDQVAESLAGKQGNAQCFCLMTKHGRQFLMPEMQDKTQWIESISAQVGQVAGNRLHAWASAYI